MNFIIKPIVCDYGVMCVDTGKVICICNIKANAELIADILNGDNHLSCAWSYALYPNAKYKIVKKEVSK